MASNVGVSVTIGLDGPTYALVGLLLMILVPIAVRIGLVPVGRTLRDVGLHGPHVARDAAIGAGVAIGFAVLQFTILIPVTGGAERSDIVVNAAQVGDSGWGVAGFVFLAWTGGFAEELLFRGHLMTTLRRAFGGSRGALVGAGVVVVVLFAALHGYQGWAGVLDTGLYGGVVLTALFVATGFRLTACTVAHAGWNTLATFGIVFLY